MISEPEWLSIGSMVEKIVRRVVGTRGDFHTTGIVIKVDEVNKCVFLKEFGDQPIPLVYFDYKVKYYDTFDSGVAVKTANVQVVMPKIGDSVLVARELGTRRLPRCLGVIQGTNWIVPEEE